MSLHRISRHPYIALSRFDVVLGEGPIVNGSAQEVASELLVRIRVLLAEIPRGTLNAVFLEWMERLQKWVQVDDEYVR
jgi:hypothetical protein